MHITKDTKLSFLISAGIHACFLSVFLFISRTGASTPEEKKVTFTKVSLKSSSDSAIKPLLKQIEMKRKNLPKFNIALNTDSESFRDYNTGIKRTVSKDKISKTPAQKRTNNISFDFSEENTQNSDDSLFSYAKKTNVSNLKSKTKSKSVFKNKSSKTQVQFFGNDTAADISPDDVFETSYGDTETNDNSDVTDITFGTLSEGSKTASDNTEGTNNVLRGNDAAVSNAPSTSDTVFFDIDSTLSSSNNNNDSSHAYGSIAAGTSENDGVGIKIIGDISKRKVIKYSTPKYPDWLSKKRVEPSVTLSFSVLPDGKVKDTIMVKRSSGYVELDKISIKALRKWFFSPLKSGKMLKEEKGEITFKFSLR